MNQKFDKEFFEKILNSIYSSKCSNISVSKRSAVEDGEHYSSELLRVKVSFNLNTSEREKSFILKNSLGDNLRRSIDVFAKEIRAYNEIIPRVESFFIQNGIALKLAPICYKNDVRESYLVLEDLSERNYSNIDRKHGLDRHHLKHTIEKLAKWHTATADITANNNFSDLFRMAHVRIDGSAQYRSLFENAMNECINLFQDDDEMGAVVKRLSEIKDNIFEKCCLAVARNDNEYNVLTHGDLWCNNVLFNELDDAMFVSKMKFITNFHIHIY